VIDLRECAADELAEAMDRLHGLVCLAHRRLAAVAAEYDRRKAWEADGAASMAAWLALRLGVSHRTGSEWARAGEALGSLPALGQAFEDGLLSFDQVAPLSRMATPETDEALAEEAMGWSAAQCAAAARHARAVPEDEARDCRQRRSLRLRWDLDARTLHVHGRLPDETGAALEAAIEKIVDGYKPDPETGVFDAYERRAADALAELASSYLGAQASPDRATVVIVAEAAAAAGEGGAITIDGGPPIGVHALWRNLCDARVELVGPDGVGRARRAPPAWLCRRVRRRDGSCRFPSCDRRRWGHVHHLRHWINGGPTDLDNLVWLCPFHHRLVHEGGWSTRGDPNGELTFIRPDGRPLARGSPARAERG